MLNKYKMILASCIALMMLLGGACKQAKYEFTKRAEKDNGPENPVDEPKEGKQEEKPEEEKEETLPPNHFKGENGFEIKATPDNGGIDEPITFEGNCGDNADEPLTWQFGDGKSGKGNKTTHKYSESRKFVVDASCKDKDGKERRGSIIIYIAPGKKKKESNPNQNPGQKPNQSNPGQNTQKPNQG